MRASPPLWLRERWNRWRMTTLLPELMREFGRRDGLEVLDCAEAVLEYHVEKEGRCPPPSLVRRQTRDCLLAGTCEEARIAERPSSRP